MDPAFIQSLESTLRDITAPATVKQASARLQSEFLPNPQSLPGLIQILKNASDANIRQLAGIEARKQVAKFWTEENALPEDMKSQIRSSLLQSTVQESHPLPRHTSSRVISAIAQLDVDEGRWDDLLPQLFNSAENGNSVEREVSVYILYTLLEAGINVLLDSKLVPTLHLFSRTINDPENPQVRVSTVLGLGSVSEIIESASVPGNAPADQNPVEIFRALIPGMVEVLKQVISSDDDKGISQVFEVFNGLLLCDPALISKHLGDLLQFMLTHIAAERNLSDECRIPALQFIMTAIRFKKNKIQSLKMGPVLTKSFLEIAAEGENEEEDEEDEETPAQMALRAIDYLSSGLPPSQVMSPLFEALPNYVNSDKPGHRRAAFLALTAAVEGSPDFVANNINVVLPTVVNGLDDRDIAVKSAALQALAELASELHEVVSDEHEVLLPLVFNIMDGASTLKIGKNACLALDAILEGIDRKVIADKYLSSLAPKLLQLLNSTNDASLKSSIVAAISSASFSAGAAYMPYFQSTIEAVEPFVRVGTANPDSLSVDELSLCGITFDALSALAGAVGKEVFRPYVEPLMGYAYKSLQSNHNRLKECGFLFVGAVARVYGAEFTPFLQTIVPEIFKCLDQDEFDGLLDNEDDAQEMIGQDDEDEDLLNKYKINGALATEKEIATEALGEIIIATKKDFEPFLETATRHLISLVDHFYDGIAKASLVALWRSVTAFYRDGTNPEKWQPGFPATYKVTLPAEKLIEMSRTASLELLSNVDERSVATTLCDSLADAIKVCGPVILGSKEDLESLCGELLLILGKNHPSQTMDEDDYEYDGKQDAEEDSGENSEYDEVLTDSAMDVIVQIAAAMGTGFESVLTAFSPVISKYCTSSSATERASGVGAFAEIINGIRENVTPFTEDLMAVLLRGLNDKDLEVRSNSAYGIGLLCLYSNNTQFVQSNYITILQKLQRLLKKVEKKRKSFGNNGDNEDDTNDRGLANACGCVSRMALRFPELIPMGEVLPVLLSRLPLQDGFEENTPVFELIIDLFQKGNETMIAHTEQVVQIAAQVFTQQAEKESEKESKFGSSAQIVMPLETDEIKNKVIELLKYLESQHPGSVSSHQVLAKAMSA